MKNSKGLLAVSGVVLLFMGSTPSQARDHRDGFEYRSVSGSQSGDFKPEMISGAGVIRCKDGCSPNGGDCDLEFVRSSDGEAFDVSENQELRALHCSDHKRDLKVKLTGEREPRFLFWGGDLIVKTFEVQGEIPTQLCSVSKSSSEQSRTSNLFSRGDIR